MKKSHRVGDMFKEYYEDFGCRENGNFLIWRIDNISKGDGQYRCVCIEDDGEDECNVGDYVHFYWKNYAEWINNGTMIDHEPNHFEEELFEI